MKNLNILLSKIFDILNLKKKSSYVILLIFILITSILETFTVGAFFPLISLLTKGKEVFLNLNIVKNNSIINEFFTNQSTNEIILFSIIFLISLFIVKNFLILFFHWYRESFNFSLRSKLSSTIFYNNLVKNHSSFYKKNSSEYMSMTLNQTSEAVDAITGMIYLINELLVFILIFSLILVINYQVSLFAIFSFMIFFIPFILKAKQKVREWASIKIVKDHNQIKNLNEGLSMFKILKVHNIEKIFYDKFRTNNSIVNNVSKLISFFSFIPRYSLETIAILVIFSILSYFIINGYKPVDAFPILAVFLMAAARILPSINKIANSIQVVNAGTPAINSLSKELKKKKTKFPVQLKYSEFNNMELKDVSFWYDHKNKLFSKLNLAINKGDKVIIKGQSGVGKSSLIEIILGLRKANSGKVFFNNQEPKTNEFYKKIKFSYLPQQNFVVDDTIVNNILLNNSKISQSRLSQILKICQLDQMINKLRKKEKTYIGEQGISISGGQKQRICLARALAYNPSILILDESTNALDITNEEKILNSIIKDNYNLTIIMVTHRKIDSKYFNKVIDMYPKKINIKDQNVQF